jgi:hypothetical protein
MAVSMDSIWTECRALAGQHGELLGAIAGVLFFLPALAVAMFLPLPEIRTMGVGAFEEMIRYYQDNLGWLLLAQIPVLLGSAAAFAMMLAPARPTVGQALGSASRMFIGFALLAILIRIGIGAGLFLFVLPGLYLMARTFVAEPAMMAEGIASPSVALARGIRLSSGFGWRIVALIVIFAIVLWVALSVVALVIGIVATLVLPKAGVTTVSHLLAALQSAVLATGFVVLAAGAYRQLAAPSA